MSMGCNPRLALHAILDGYRPVLEVSSAEVLELSADDRALLLDVGITPAMLDRLTAMTAAAPINR